MVLSSDKEMRTQSFLKWQKGESEEKVVLLYCKDHQNIQQEKGITYFSEDTLYIRESILFDLHMERFGFFFPEKEKLGWNIGKW